MADRACDAVLGIGFNALAPAVAVALERAAQSAGIVTRKIDLDSLSVGVAHEISVEDNRGPVVVTHLAPSLLYWQEAAALGMQVLESQGVLALNPVDASLLADDKAKSSLRLHQASVPQVPTLIVGQDLASILEACLEVGFPVVIKRTHGAQGRWVRMARTVPEAETAFAELVADGPGALVVQPLIEEFFGRSIRVIVTGGNVVASSLRQGPPNTLVSNISRGGSQQAVTLTSEEVRLSIEASRALGLGHAGVDLMRTRGGAVVLEVNACPDFTSMSGVTSRNIEMEVVMACIA